MGKTRLLYSFIKEIFKRPEIISFFLNNNFEKEKERNLNDFKKFDKFELKSLFLHLLREGDF
jgi:hypothetical protein